MSSPKGPGERGLKVLEVPARYGIVHDQAIARVLDVSLNAARKAGSALERDGWLAVANRNTECKHYYLTMRSVRLLGLDEKRARPPGPYQLVELWGILDFCLSHSVKKFTYREWAEKYPPLHRHGLHTNYFREVDQTDGTNRIGYILVDHGDEERHILPKIQKNLSERHKLPEFSRMILDYRYVIAIVTPSEGKKKSLVDLLRAELTESVVIRVHVATALEHLLLGKRGGS
jgi:hypothetical protein